LFARHEMTVESFISFAAASGFEGVDLGYYWEDKERELPLVEKWLARAGIALSGYIVGNNFGGVAGTDQAPAEVVKVKTAVDEACALGAPTLRIFAGGREGLAWEEGKWLILDLFRECTAYAEKRNVILALEDHHGLAANSTQLLFYLHQINSPFFRFNVDIGNFLFGGEEPVAGTTKTAPYAAMVHVKDFRQAGDAYEACALGEGVVPVADCLRILRDAGYDSFVSLEYEAPEDPRTGIPRSADFLRHCIAHQ